MIDTTATKMPIQITNLGTLSIDKSFDFDKKNAAAQPKVEPE
jgi:hypothetical protein